MGARVPRHDSDPIAPPVTKTRLRMQLEAAVLFAVATLILTYPLATQPSSLSRFDNGDARLNAWAISWVSHQLTHDPLRLFEANTFYPLPHSLAFSEHLTLHGLLAFPLLTLSDDLTLTTNLLLLGYIWFSAFAMYWLAKTLTGSHAAALLAGLFFSFAPFRFNRLPHIQMQLYAFLPLLLLSLHRFLLTRRRIFLVGLSAFFVLQALAGTYLGAIAAVALSVGLVTLTPFARLEGRDVLAIVLSLGAAAVLLVPFAVPYLWVNRELGVEWDLEGMASLSATAWSYAASGARLYRPALEVLLRGREVTDYLFPGFTVLGLGVVGAWDLARRPGRRSILLCYTTILVVGVAVSLGPRLPLYPFLYEHVVFFRGLRALTRFGLLPLFTLTVLSGYAISWLFETMHRQRTRRLVAGGIALFFVAESVTLPYDFQPHADEPPEVYRWLAEAGPGPIAELPFKVIDTRYMFWARHHGFRSTLNGDSGFIPVSHQWMKIALQRFPSSDAIALLRSLDVKYVVLHLPAFRRPTLLRILRTLPDHRDALLPVRDFGKELVFEVVSDGETTSVQATTDWQTLVVIEPHRGRGEEGLLSFDIELPRTSRLRAIRLHYGSAPRVPVERVEVLGDSGGNEGPETRFATPPDWPAVSELVLGLLRTPQDGTQTVVVEDVWEHRLRLRLHGLDGEQPELTTIELLGSFSSSAGL
ncbi:MAG TPA: hypothetical protein VEK15_15845 [Vicinamibacteria bacterium]|nr:hypothetical protein [Vicinamibacteria bacterium]